MPKFHTVKAGDVLWDVHREKMGNTTMSRLGAWQVRVISIDYENETAMCSWNTNPPRLYFKRGIERLRRTKPEKAHG